MDGAAVRWRRPGFRVAVVWTEACKQVEGDGVAPKSKPAPQPSPGQGEGIFRNEKMYVEIVATA